MSCRILAAAAFPVTSKHQLWPSIGPAAISGRNDSGISDSMALSRPLDSLLSSASRPNVGEFSTAWWTVMARVGGWIVLTG